MEPLFGKLESLLEKGVAVSSGSPAKSEPLLFQLSPHVVPVASSRSLSSVIVSQISLKNQITGGHFVKATNSQIPSLESSG